jgi:entericidin A
MFFAGLLTACNTMEGAGEDLERGGEKIQEKASDAKD